MNGHLLRGSLAVVMICSALSTGARAQSAWVFVGDGDHPVPSCTRGPGAQFVYVHLGSAAGTIGSARFKVVASSPVTFLNPLNGDVDVTFSPCTTIGPLVSLLVIVPAGPSVTFSIVPATGYSEIELTDCEGYAMPTVTSCGPPRLSAPYRPNPPDGATDVPTNQLLSYVGVANSVGIGTSPNLGQVICQGEPPCALPLNPGLLAPHTTYYWRAGTVCFCDGVLGGTSELFSFTTGDGPLAVEATTWGRVKALYRE